MKKLLYTLLFIMILTGCMISRAQSSSSDDEPAPADSTIDVIGWFTTIDTAEYWISTASLKITEHDTIALLASSSKVRIVVTDSTSEGYKMKYTIIDVRSDSIDDPQALDYQNRITETYGRKMIGTTIYFETNELGKITKINNLEQIKERLKAQLKDISKDIASHPGFEKRRGAGIDVDKEIQEYMDKIDYDSYTERFLTPLNLIFSFHGLSFQVGEKYSYEEETESSYAYEDVITAEYIDRFSYFIGVEVSNIIPMTDLYDFLRTIVDNPTDSRIYDTIITMQGAEMKSYNILNLLYRYDGWPNEIYSQDVSSFGTIGKASITRILLDNIPDHNY